MKNPQILDLYSDYCITAFTLVTATGLSKLIDEGYSHDQISHFLSQKELTQKDFWKMVKRLIRKIEHENGIISIDDTFSEKPHTTENEIVCFHWDHSKNRTIKGINVLNFVYCSEVSNGEESDQVTLPIAYEIIKKTEKYYDTKSKKIKRRSPISKNELARERLRVLTELNKVKYRYIVWDSWFSSKDNLNFIHYNLKKFFVGALKSNRKVALSEQEKGQGKYVRVDALEFQSNCTRIVWLKGLDFPVQVTKRIFTNKDGSTGELYIISNDAILTVTDLFAIYEKRWRVEVFHKSLKQNASLSKSPTKYEVTQSNHIFASMIAYCKLEILKIKEKKNHFAIKSQLYLKALQAAYKELLELKKATTHLLPKNGSDLLCLG